MTLIRAHAWPVAAAIVVGFVLLPVAQREYAEWDRERTERAERGRPVVTMRGELVESERGVAVIRLIGTKHRDCRYLSIEAYSVDAVGTRSLANIAKADGVNSRGKTHPVGAYDFGLWRVWPITSGAVRAMVFVEHVCNNVAVKTLAAEVRL